MMYWNNLYFIKLLNIEIYVEQVLYALLQQVVGNFYFQRAICSFSLIIVYSFSRSVRPTHFCRQAEGITPNAGWSDQLRTTLIFNNATSSLVVITLPFSTVNLNYKGTNKNFIFYLYWSENYRHNSGWSVYVSGNLRFCCCLDISETGLRWFLITVFQFVFSLFLLQVRFPTIDGMFPSWPVDCLLAMNMWSRLSSSYLHRSVRMLCTIIIMV